MSRNEKFSSSTLYKFFPIWHRHYLQRDILKVSMWKKIYFTRKRILEHYVTAKNILTAVFHENVSYCGNSQIARKCNYVNCRTKGRHLKPGFGLYVSRRLAMHKITRDRDKSDMPLRIKAQKAIGMKG